VQVESTSRLNKKPAKTSERLQRLANVTSQFLPPRMATMFTMILLRLATPVVGAVLIAVWNLAGCSDE
jgi:hypothetical protein